MIQVSDSKKKAFMLIGNGGLHHLVRNALEKCNFEVEKFLGLIQQCQIFIIDHFYFQFGIAEYLKDKGIKKPVYLILDQGHVQLGSLRSSVILHDIIVVRNQDRREDSASVISALRGEMILQNIFKEGACATSPCDSKMLASNFGKDFIHYL